MPPAATTDTAAERKAVLQRTSDAIKAVQSQFAVKHELATQADSGYACMQSMPLTSCETTPTGS